MCALSCSAHRALSSAFSHRANAPTANDAALSPHSTTPRVLPPKRPRSKPSALAGAAKSHGKMLKSFHKAPAHLLSSFTAMRVSFTNGPGPPRRTSPSLTPPNTPSLKSYSNAEPVARGFNIQCSCIYLTHLGRLSQVEGDINARQHVVRRPQKLVLTSVTVSVVR